MENNAIEKTCSFCGEEINPFQKRCPYCGSLLTKISKSGTLDIGIKETSGSNIEKTIAIIKDDSIFDNSSDEGHSDRELLGLDDASESEDTNLQNPVVIDSVSDSMQTHMGNKIKVFLTTLFVIIPGIGQIAGLIASIMFMNSQSRDKKSYGKALFTVCIIVFIITIIFYLLLGTIFLNVISRY